MPRPEGLADKPKRAPRVKALPSRIYAYGAHEPTEGLDRVREQLHLAHRYRNTLVEIERRRRERTDAALASHAPDLANVEKQIADAEARLEEAKARKPADEATVKAVKAALKPLRARRKEIRSTLFAEDSTARAALDAVDAQAGDEVRAARATCGVYWGTYLAVEDSMKSARKGAPPEFRRERDQGWHKLAVQIQKSNPLTPADLTGEDTRLRVEVKPEGVWVQGKRRPKKLGNALAKFRIGSDERGGPIFTTVPFVMHRPLPEGASVKWAYLQVSRVGLHERWEIQFVLSQEAWEDREQAPRGGVAIDVGWRVMEDRRLRVAYWVASDGTEGELSLPVGWIDEHRKTEAIRSQRDLDFDAVRKALAEVGGDRPTWWGEATQHMAAWRAPGKLAALALRWREEVEGPLGRPVVALPPGLAILEAWRKRDRHLLLYEANVREQLQAQRRHLYRCFARSMSRRYAVAVFEGEGEGEGLMDLRDFHELPPEGAPAGAAGERGPRKEHVASRLAMTHEHMS